jgi:hypothetical protein
MISCSSPLSIDTPWRIPRMSRSSSLPSYHQSLLTSHTRSGLAIVRGGMHLTMDIEPLKKIWSMTRERVRWSACAGIISGAISLVLFASFNVETAGAQSTPPAPTSSASPSSTPAQVGTTHPEKAQLSTASQNIKVQTSPKVTEVLNSPASDHQGRRHPDNSPQENAIQHSAYRGQRSL